MSKKNTNQSDNLCCECGKPMRAEKSSNVHSECLRVVLEDTEIELYPPTERTHFC